ncbi:DNA methyltransferase [Halomonas sp. AOP43-D1-4]|uniref:DNA methyltransferase n=1 Tax=Halomonas sp. AOP43-D1-4 TaxID=3457658 RepID=UPI004034D38F
MTLKQKRDRYEMHKYWGKKPSSDLGDLVRKYSNEGETVLDPFSGYGVFCCEAYILNRNVISNDLNPVSNFINETLFNKDIDIEKVEKEWKQIREKFVDFNNEWFEWSVDGEKVILTSVLRDKDDVPIKAKYLSPGERKAREIDLAQEQAKEFLKYEEFQEISDWYPDEALIENSRISARKGMSVASLFTKRTLSCHARLFSLINQVSSGNERELLKLAFTANLANCSRLVPPIKSRGAMAPGAWMTGFYTGDTYIENNVLVYFENRLKKAIKGKREYLGNFQADGLFSEPNEHSSTYRITDFDAKNLKLAKESIDYIFADPPYGEAVPYFEQSIIWNSWLRIEPDYENEIVISDSKVRSKRGSQFETDIDKAFSEIRRVLKSGKYFSLTYHSLSGYEWRAITNACVRNGFELYEFEWLVQKSFTPRQINRMKTIKGDVLVTFRKLSDIPPYKETGENELASELAIMIRRWLYEKPLDTNQIFLKVMEYIFRERIVSGPIDLLELLINNFEFNEMKLWVINDKLELQTA